MIIIIKREKYRGKKTPFMSTDGYAFNSWVDTENIIFLITYLII